MSLSGTVSIGPTLNALRQALAEAISQADGRLIVDCEGLTFVDSAALGEFVAARRHATEKGIRLSLARARGKVRDMFELTRLDELIEIDDRLSE